MKVIEVNMERRRNEGVGGNGRSPRKPADQRHRPTRFQHAKVRELHMTGAHNCEVTTFLSELHMTGAHNCEVTTFLSELHMTGAHNCEVTTFLSELHMTGAHNCEVTTFLSELHMTGAHDCEHDSNLEGVRSRNFACGYRTARCRWSAGFLRGSPVHPAPHSGTAPCSLRFTPVGSQDIGVESRPNLLAHSLTEAACWEKGFLVSRWLPRAAKYIPYSLRCRQVYRLFTVGIGKSREFNGLCARLHNPLYVTPHLTVRNSLFVPLQVGYWCGVVKGVSYKLWSNCKACAEIFPRNSDVPRYRRCAPASRSLACAFSGRASPRVRRRPRQRPRTHARNARRQHDGVVGTATSRKVGRAVRVMCVAAKEAGWLRRASKHSACRTPPRERRRAPWSDDPPGHCNAARDDNFLLKAVHDQAIYGKVSTFENPLNSYRDAKFALLFGIRLNFTVLYALEPASFLHWLLHRNEATPFLTELHFSPDPTSPQCSRVLRAPSRIVSFTRPHTPQTPRPPSSHNLPSLSISFTDVSRCTTHRMITALSQLASPKRQPTSLALPEGGGGGDSCDACQVAAVNPIPGCQASDVAARLGGGGVRGGSRWETPAEQSPSIVPASGAVEGA
ncbi:hypothetical protein PR048_030727 [Dryococelus australis]|uniref:Uncharacterized protein n=1 Tax=Dryococelus australis TaxID=614101 RepID=A0ABQ9GDL2_9NEOP|nr:hypothetical protein PR048_030727 [Dryococelus australis]